MTRIKHIDGIMWASDILNGQKEFPTFNKKEPDAAAERAAAGADFARVFSKACADLEAQQGQQAHKV